MKPLTPARKGWTRTLGRAIVHTNWSRSWDGWRRTKATKHGPTVDWYPLAIIPFRMANGSIGVRFYLLWLILWFGWASASSKDSA